MNRWEAWFFRILAAVVSVTGVAYLWMKHLIHNDDPFALVNHPWQLPMLKLHILAAPFLILLLGMVLKSHILQQLSAGVRTKRRSGILIGVTCALMVLSGYLLQIVSEPLFHRAALIVHLATGVAFVGGFVVHQGFTLIPAKDPGARQPQRRIVGVEH
jgi:hypothetical protein